MKIDDEESQGPTDGKVLGIYHININSSNLEKTQEFYELLGFRVVDHFHMQGQADHDAGLGLRDADVRAVFMVVGGNTHATVLDIAEWTHPPLQRRANEMTSVGVPRFAMRVKGLDKLVARLRSKGVKFLTDEVATIGVLKRKPRFICARDPDGLIVEFVEMKAS